MSKKTWVGFNHQLFVIQQAQLGGSVTGICWGHQDDFPIESTTCSCTLDLDWLENWRLLEVTSECFQFLGIGEPMLYLGVYVITHIYIYVGDWSRQLLFFKMFFSSLYGSFAGTGFSLRWRNCIFNIDTKCCCTCISGHDPSSDVAQEGRCWIASGRPGAECDIADDMPALATVVVQL